MEKFAERLPISANRSPNGNDIVSSSLDYAQSHSIVMYSKQTQQLTHAPYSLLPTPIPRSAFDQATALGPDFNVLVDKICQDPKFIIESLESTAEDPFTTELLKIYKEMLEKNLYPQPITFGIFRSDYMLDAVKGKEPGLKQVELNTIAASFSNLSTKTSEMHRYIIERFGDTVLENRYNLDNLPKNQSFDGLPNAMADAVKAYGVQGAIVVMIVHPGETNTFDQRWLEYTLFQKHGITLVRKSLTELAEISLRSDGAFVVDKKEVALIYFRAGYSPEDYPTEVEWKSRRNLEQSRAIKCPNIPYHLAGTKKIQQVLALPGQVERFVQDEKSVQRLRNCFTGLYSLTEGEEGVDQILKILENDPTNYVLKPQREGGGNNIYGQDITHALQKMNSRQKSAYIVMDRIHPPEISGHFIRNSELLEVKGVSELGIYSVFLKVGEEVKLNQTAGHLLRTKVSHVDDGGVAAGVAVLDSPYLY